MKQTSKRQASNGLIAFLKNNKLLAIIILFIVALLIILICVGHLEAKEKEFWPDEILSALLGAAIVAAITILLMKGQANSESEVEQKKKVFENRLTAYEFFLNTLKKVVVNNKVDDRSEKLLQFGIATIGMHSDSKDMLIVSKNLKCILQKIKVSDRVDGSIWNELMNIVNVFHNSLYVNEPRVVDKDMRKAIRNFSSLCVDENYKVLEFIECLLSSYQFDSFIIGKCLSYCIHIKEKPEHNQIVFKKLYVTVCITECVGGDTYNGTIAIYNNRKDDKEFDNLLAKLILCKIDMEKREKQELGLGVIEHGWYLDFFKKKPMALQAAIGDLFVFLQPLWAEDGDTFLLRNNNGNLKRVVYNIK